MYHAITDSLKKAGEDPDTSVTVFCAEGKFVWEYALLRDIHVSTKYHFVFMILRIQVTTTFHLATI